MSGIWGKNIIISVFGESHGAAIGGVIDGLPSGMDLDIENIKLQMRRRAPGIGDLTTSRQEDDDFEILSGYFNGYTTGTPLSFIIRNKDKKSSDYESIRNIARPGHADYTGRIKYKGFNDYRGGGHFSGRLTAPLVFAGAICSQILESKGIKIISHIKTIGKAEDKSFDFEKIERQIIDKLKNRDLPVICEKKAELMRQEILMGKENEDSVGGIIECAIIGAPAGLGDPFFDSVESKLSHILFSIPAVKGVEFGAGFKISKMKGSQANDEIFIDNGKVITKGNYNGGIVGGITNGMPIIFRVAIKPTSSIGKMQNTIHMEKMEETKISIQGRHDPCIVPRAVPVIEAASAIVIADMLMERGECFE